MSGQVISKTQKGRAFPHHTAGDSLNQSLNISGWSDKLELLFFYMIERWH